MDPVPQPAIRDRQSVYLSPHFDDIALSCGGWAAQTGGLCITLFAAPPPPEVPLSPYAQRLHARWGEPNPAAGNALRRAEERAATTLLGLDLCLLDYPDAIYRPGLYLNHAGIFGDVHPDEADLPAELAAAVATELTARGIASPTIYAPLGLGHHVDHQLTYLAAGILARRGWEVFYYEDFPYAANVDGHTARFAELQDRFAPQYAGIDATIATKIGAIAAYPSQISSLFPSLEAMPSVVRAYAATVAAAWQHDGVQYAERYWHLVDV